MGTMMRKEIILQAALVLTLLTSLIIGVQDVKAQSTSPFTTTQTIREPIVSFTQWHTSTSVIQTPANRLADIQPIVEIISPQNQSSFQTSNVTLTIDVASYFWIIDSVYYQADWQAGIHQIFGVQPNYDDALNASITATFTQIPLGNHTVEIYANTHDDMHALSAVTFSTEGYLPKITCLSLENQTYTSKQLTLNFTVDKPTSWIGYSLDGQENITLNDHSIFNIGAITNLTIANLTSGFHSLTVYANDTMGDMSASQPINFNIASSAVTKQILLPTGFIIALVSTIIVIVCIGFSLGFYFKKRKVGKVE
jgi:hypothetical protein